VIATQTRLGHDLLGKPLLLHRVQLRRSGREDIVRGRNISTGLLAASVLQESVEAEWSWW